MITLTSTHRSISGLGSFWKLYWFFSFRVRERIGENEVGINRERVPVNGRANTAYELRGRT